MQLRAIWRRRIQIAPPHSFASRRGRKSLLLRVGGVEHREDSALVPLQFIRGNLPPTALMLRLHLPPNLTAAAGRDAVALRVDIDLSAPPAEELLPVLALLQRWCGSGVPPKFIQVTRAQLRDLAQAAGDQPIFLENGKATVWRHDELVAPPASIAPEKETPASPAKKAHARSDGQPLVVDGSEPYLAVTLPSREHPRYADALTLLKEH